MNWYTSLFNGYYDTVVIKWAVTPHFIVLYFIALYRYYILLKLKVCSNPATSKSVGAIFPIAFACFLSHFGSSHDISNFSLLVFYGDLWSLIFNVTIVIILEHYELHPCKMMNIIDKYVYSDCSMDQPVPSLSAFSGLLILWTTAILKLDQLITLQWPLKCSS